MKYGDVNLGQIEAFLNRIGGVEGMQKINSGEWIVGEPSSVKKPKSNRSNASTGLLEPFGEPVQVEGAIQFVPCKRIVKGLNGDLPISYVGENFQKVFADLVEDDVPAVSLKQRKLLKRSLDGPILSALRGKKRAKIALVHAFDFLKTADRSKWYIFYVADSKGVLWAVYAYWDGVGWPLSTVAVARPVEWDAGSVVVSC